MVCCILGCKNNRAKNITERRCVQNKLEEISFHIFPHPNKDQYRHKQWIKACNNPKVLIKDSMTVYKRFRICRLHFDVECFNGACKRLLNTAVPTLHLNSNFKTREPTPENEYPTIEFLNDDGMSCDTESQTYNDTTYEMLSSEDDDSDHIDLTKSDVNEYMETGHTVDSDIANRSAELIVDEDNFPPNTGLNF